MLGGSVATMVLTPLLLATAPAVGARLVRGRSSARDDEGIPHLSDHVVILGFGVGGRLVSRALADLNVPYLILELNGATVQRARAQGERIFYGDATNPESLRAAGVEFALGVVSTLSDPDATLRMVKAARAISATVPIIVRTRYRLEAERLQATGADVAVAEELEASLEVVAQLLARLNVPGNVIEPLLTIFRRESTSLRPLYAPRTQMQSLPSAIRQMPVSTHRIGAEDWAGGRTIGELDLRAKTSASVIAIQRAGSYLTTLTPGERLQPDDVLYLVGDETDVMLARELLSRGAMQGAAGRD
jgi:CPA2 family monovalent cation:H+ antiporter-2